MSGKFPSCLYIVDCDYTHFYIGITSNPQRREEEHRKSLRSGSFFVKRHGFKSFTILAWFENTREGLKAEQHYTHIMRRKYKNWTIAGAKVGHLE